MERAVSLIFGFGSISLDNKSQEIIKKRKAALKLSQNKML